MFFSAQVKRSMIITNIDYKNTKNNNSKVFYYKAWWFLLISLIAKKLGALNFSSTF